MNKNLLESYVLKFKTGDHCNEYMKMPVQRPIVLYDDMCSVCTRFAKTISFFARHRISLVGHYSQEGLHMRSLLGENATKMFWVVDENTAFGGRSAILPLLRNVCNALGKKIPISKHGKIKHVDCTTCNNSKAVFIRSASLIRESQKIKI